MRAEAAFVEPKECKSVTALPGSEKWTFEVKFDGYRCIAVKLGGRSRYFRAIGRCSTGASLAWWRRLPRLMATLFSTGSWSP